MARPRSAATLGGFLVLATLVAAQAPNQAEEFLAQVAGHFRQWDRDGNGELSREEIDAAVADPANTGKAAAAVAALKRAVRSSRYQLPPLSEKVLRQLVAAGPAADKPNWGGLYADGLGRINRATSRELFATGLPQLTTIHQGKLGNCFCLAPLGAMVHRDPKQVAAMFALQEDGGYLVTLGKHQVRVAPLTDAELALTASNERDGVWINLYEKAVGEALNREKPEAQRSGSPIDVLGKGGSAGTMLAFITGHPILRFSCKFATDPAVTPAEREAKLKELRERLTAAAKGRRLITCGTLKTTTPGLTPNHAYAVLGYDAQADALQVWNPHGGQFSPKGPAGPAHGYTRADGVFTVPLAEFVQLFSGLAFEMTDGAK